MRSPIEAYAADVAEAQNLLGLPEGQGYMDEIVLILDQSDDEDGSEDSLVGAPQ